MQSLRIGELWINGSSITSVDFAAGIPEHPYARIMFTPGCSPYGQDVFVFGNGYAKLKDALIGLNHEHPSINPQDVLVEIPVEISVQSIANEFANEIKLLPASY